MGWASVDREVGAVCSFVCEEAGLEVVLGNVDIDGEVVDVD